MRLSKIPNSYERVAVAEDRIMVLVWRADRLTALATVLQLTDEFQTNAKLEQGYLREINSRKVVFQVTQGDIIETKSALRRLPVVLIPHDDALSAQIRKIIEDLDIDEAAWAIRAVMDQLIARSNHILRPT